MKTDFRRAITEKMLKHEKENVTISVQGPFFYTTKHNHLNIIITIMNRGGPYKASIGPIYRFNLPEGPQLRRLSGAQRKVCAEFV